jgi:hypothetical protein
MGNEGQASEYFRLAYETDTSSDIGKTAYSLING